MKPRKDLHAAPETAPIETRDPSAAVNVEGLLCALRATGAGFWEAVNTVMASDPNIRMDQDPYAVAWGCEVFRKMFVAAKRHTDPVFWCGGSLRLPGDRPKHEWKEKLKDAIFENMDSLHVKSDLMCLNRVHLQKLPENLCVEGTLSLEGAVQLKSLPKGLVIKRSLILADCPSWDGIIPEDAEIGGAITTDEGRWSLKKWREKERAGNPGKVRR